MKAKLIYCQYGYNECKHTKKNQYLKASQRLHI